MAEDKKPKIDLKARLGKTGLNQVPGAAPSGAIPAPPVSVPAPASSIPAPTGLPIAPQSVPVPMAAASAPAMGGDPLGLAGMGTPFRPSAAAAAPVAPPQPQRIEMDEGTIQEARSGAFKKALGAGVVLAALFGVVGYVAGGAGEKSNGRAAAKEDAKTLESRVVASKATLENLQKKTEAAREALAKGEFPEQYTKELGGINVDFTGAELGGRRFSGFKVETTKQLVSYITGVQQVNDHKDAIARLLSRLEKPMKEQLTNKDKATIGFVILVGRKDANGNPYGLLAPLSPPLSLPKAKLELPNEFTFVDPESANRSNGKVDRYKGGALDKPAAIYVNPGTIEKAFPSERSTAAGQLAVKLAEFITEIKGQGAGDPNVVQDSKPGLIEQADILIKGLQAAQN